MKLSLSGLATAVKQGLVDAEVGELVPPQFFLTNLETEEDIELAMIPETVNVKTSANFRTYNIVERGEVSLPKGERLQRLSWQSILPDASLLLQNVLTAPKSWDKPEEIIKDIQRWQKDGDRIQVLITDTPINAEFYIHSFTTDAWKMGNWKYSIEFIAAESLEIKTVEEVDEERAKAEELKNRPRKKSKLGARLSKIDSYYAMAKILTGKGSLSDIENVLGFCGVSSDFIDAGKDILSVTKIISGKSTQGDLTRVAGKAVRVRS